MSEDKLIPLNNPGAPTPVVYALTEVLREGAQRMLAAAIEAEVTAFLERFKDEKTADGRQRVVRNDHLPMRSLQTGEKRRAATAETEWNPPFSPSHRGSRVKDRFRKTSIKLPPDQL